MVDIERVIETAKYLMGKCRRTIEREEEEGTGQADGGSERDWSGFIDMCQIIYRMQKNLISFHLP